MVPSCDSARQYRELGVYTETGGDFEAHDGCGCTVEPVYDRDADWPEGASELKDLWQEASAGSDNPLNDFRRALAEQRAGD